MGKSSINGQVSMAMLNNQRVSISTLTQTWPHCKSNMDGRFSPLRPSFVETFQCQVRLPEGVSYPLVNVNKIRWKDPPCYFHG